MFTKEGLTIGFPNPAWNEFPGEVRAFLPDYIAQVGVMSGATVVIPEGYGIRMNPNLDYTAGNIHSLATDDEVYKASDVIVSLKFPPFQRVSLMPRQSILISMIHFSTKPERVAALLDHQISGISLDSVTNDSKERLVEDMKATAWNALNATFGYIREGDSPLRNREVLRVLVLGSGQLGKQAVDASVHWGGINGSTLPPADVRCVGRSITEGKREYLMALLEDTDILVDATARRQLLTPVIYNEELGHFPQDGVVVDLAADPYSQHMVKAIEGIPHGHLDHYIFEPGDPSYEQFVPSHIPHKEKRLTISCEAWPGIHPEKSIRHYQEQLLPLLGTLLNLGENVSQMHEQILENSQNPLVRALYRGSLRGFLSSRGEI